MDFLVPEMQSYHLDMGSLSGAGEVDPAGHFRELYGGRGQASPAQHNRSRCVAFRCVALRPVASRCVAFRPVAFPTTLAVYLLLRHFLLMEVVHQKELGLYPVYTSWICSLYDSRPKQMHPYRNIPKCC